jgi:hypothetical protein
MSTAARIAKHIFVTCYVIIVASFAAWVIWRLLWQFYFTS